MKLGLNLSLTTQKPTESGPVTGDPIEVSQVSTFAFFEPSEQHVSQISTFAFFEPV